MKYALTVLTVSALLAGCANDGERVAFDGQYFSTKLRKVDGPVSYTHLTLPTKA